MNEQMNELPLPASPRHQPSPGARGTALTRYKSSLFLEQGALMGS